MRKYFILILASVLTSCTGSKQISTIPYSPSADSEQPIVVVPYQPSFTRFFNLIHTDIDIRFKWETQQALGVAQLTLKPHFYPSNNITLNAQGMDIHGVRLISDSASQKLAFNYRNDSLNIILDKMYSRNDHFKIEINYTANPEKLEARGSEYSTAKGLYFVNPLGENKNKPMQIWTQGETQASSCWFPTIDAPNVRMTQDIKITVEDRFNTLSNGQLISSVKNNDGTRTDHWKQSVPSAPYLTMLAVGEYAIVKDSWKGKEVNYYLEKEYETMGRAIFGNTPEMLTFFSNILGVEFPWEKYAQVVVRDYISGAMENSSAVVFGEFMQQDKRERLDYNFEDVISHELFHHWFGDLVTCESWANIPLNESFATYGEYLWNEHKYGRTMADHYGYEDQQAYIRESKRKQEPLIRYHFNKQDEMFDAHSYQKGGRVLHMLRKYVGDEAFFASLKLYLTEHRFEAVEIHDLRLAFEEVTGEDLHWFFDQWFMKSGHPFLDIKYSYNDSLRMQSIIIEQLQDIEGASLFKIPLLIDVYEGETPQRFKVILDKQKQEFKFPVTDKPKLVNVDAEKMLLCEKIDNKSKDEYVFQYYHAPNYLDKREAITAVGKDYTVKDADGRMIKKALSDSYWQLRQHAISQLDIYAKANPDEIKGILSYIATNDKKSLVRAEALTTLANYFPEDKSIEHIFKNATLDSSYTVMNEGLTQFTYLNNSEGLRIANKLTAEENINYIPTLSNVYSKYGDVSHHAFFDYAFRVTTNDARYSLLKKYGTYLTRCEPDAIEYGLATLKQDAVYANPWYIRLAAVQALTEVHEFVSEQKIKLQKEMNADGKTSILKQDTALSIDRFEKLELAIGQALESIKKNEKNNRLLEIYNKG